MKFIVSTKSVSLTQSKKPCNEANEIGLTPLDFRDVKTLEEAKGKIWYKNWIDNGENHREENGIIVSDKKVKVNQWVVDINSLEELLSFQNKYGDIVISDSSPYKEVQKEIILQHTTKGN
ncbi:MAG: hypothetical protein M0R70_01275 [Nitrospirae bacterium]|nr:hypothetical protein [Nitrospirota bacterium]